MRAYLYSNKHLVTVGRVELEAGLGEQVALPRHRSPEGKLERTGCG